MKIRKKLYLILDTLLNVLLFSALVAIAVIAAGTGYDRCRETGATHYECTR